MNSEQRGIHLPRRLRTLIGAALDLVGSLSLLLYALLIGPLGILLKGPLVLELTFWYLWVLLPQRLVTPAVRALVDWRLGRFDAAIAQFEGIIASCEESMRRAPLSRTRRRVLEDLYTLLVRAYMHAGHVDDAMQVVIRAKKCMGIERLPGLAELDAKTAHLVRAGLAAGRLLDGNGLATLFVKSNQPEPQPKAPAQRPKALQGATKSPLPRTDDKSPVRPRGASGTLPKVASPRGKVIPFPGMPHEHAP